MEAKINFLEVFFRCFFGRCFGIDFWSFFGGSKPEKQQFRLGGSTNFTKSTFPKKVPKNLDFGVVFGSQNDEESRKNRVEKYVFFEHRFFGVFFRFLRILARFWEAKNHQKIEKKPKKSILAWALFLRRLLRGFWEGFGRLLDEFWKDFGRICSHFS